MVFHHIRTGLLTLAALASLTVGSVMPAHATYSVDPLRIEVSFPQGRNVATTSMKVMNTGNEPIRLRAYLASWQLDDKGALTIIDEPQPGSLATWVKFNPTEFEVPVGGTQVIRMAVNAPPETPNGEFRGMLFFEDLKTATQRLQTTANGYGAAVEIKQRLGVAIYAYRGGIAAKPVVLGLKCGVTDGKLAATIDMENQGDKHARVTGTLLVQKQDGGTYKPFQEIPVNDLREIIILPGAKRTVDQVMASNEDIGQKFPVGQYRAEFLTSSKEPGAKTTPITADFAVETAPAIPPSMK